MKLTYRGVSYDYTPNPVPQLDRVLGQGHYRGVPVTFRTATELPEQPAVDLVWRGVAYRSGLRPAMPAEIPAIPAPAVTAMSPIPDAAAAPNGITALARDLFLRRHQRSRRREQGMMVRLAAEVGLPIEAAARYESHIQGKLPHDFSAYDRSGTAMS
jgi:hypothetical protein